MKPERGYKVKRQDGKPPSPDHLSEIEAVVTDFEKVAGPLADLFAKTDITISHTNGKCPLLRDAAGQYRPHSRLVIIGHMNHDGTPSKAGAHELAHWLDSEAGRAWPERNGHRSTFLSEIIRDDEYESSFLRRAANSMICSHRVTRRESQMPEVFARLVEQWVSASISGENAATEHFAEYRTRAGYWDDTIFGLMDGKIGAMVKLRIEIIRRSP